MQLFRDTILAGVRSADIEQIRQLASGNSVQPTDLTRLQANGWVEVAYGTPLITLTGRTLIESVQR